MSNTHVGAHPMIPRFIRLFSVPILLGWLALVVLVNVIAPQLEVVGEAHAVSLAPNDAPSMQAMQRIGKDFQEFDSNSSAMIVLESDKPLGDDAHQYYDGLIDKLEADKEHVEHIQDFWGDPLTAAGSQSADNKAAYVQLYLSGQPGRDAWPTTRSPPFATSSPATTPPPGLKAYVTGPARADERPTSRRRLEHQAGHHDHHLRHLRDAAVRLPLHRDRAAGPRLMFIELAAARGMVASLGYYELIGLSTFAVNLLTTLAIAAGTDYAIFLVGRYHEARKQRRGPRNRVLHHVPRHRARHPGLRPDDRRRHPVPALHAAALLPDPGHSTGHRHARRGRRRADPGAGTADHL